MRKNILLISFFLYLITGCSSINRQNIDLPNITYISIEDKTSVYDITTISVETDEDKGIEKIELWINGEFSNVFDTESPYELVWNTLHYKDTTYTIFIRLFDNSNNFTDSDTISVFVNNKHRANKYPSVSPSENHIIFFSNRNGRTQIFLSDIDGNNFTNLTGNSGNNDTQGWFPCIFSLNSSCILYQSNRDGDLDIYILNISDLSSIQVTNNTGNESSACYSPDGNHIIYNQVTGENIGLYIMNVAGTQQIQLTEGYKDIYPVFHPNGEYIIFVRRYWSENKYMSAIYRIDIDGSNLSPVSDEINAYILYPRISPDGTIIIFETDLSGNYNIYRMDIDGNNQKQLTFDSGRIESINPFFNHGQNIIYQSIQDDNGEIFVMNIDGSGKINLTNSPEFENCPVVLPQSNRIVYQSSNTNNLFSYNWTDICSMNIDGSDKMNLTNSDQDNFHLIINTKGSTIAWR